MNLKDLLYFKRLAETLSFTATADYFYISQPSISMTLKKLETELDTILIDRKKTHKNLHLTETGEILLKHSIHILTSVEQAKEEIYNLKNQVVYFGFLPTIGGYFMTQIMPYLSKFSSSMKFIEEENSDVMVDLVRNGQVPIAIVGSDQETFSEKNLLQISLKEEEMALWVSIDNYLAKKDIVTAEEIKDELFISLAHGYTHHRVFEQWTKKNNIDQSKSLYTKEIKTALSIASSTNMVAFMSNILIEDRPDLIRIPIKNAPKFYISLILNETISDDKHFQSEFNTLMIEIAKSYKNNDI